jgi:hypothetical protein
MADYFRTITDDQANLIRSAKLFFVASVDPSHEPGPHGVGPVNLSPKGGVPRCRYPYSRGKPRPRQRPRHGDDLFV